MCMECSTRLRLGSTHRLQRPGALGVWEAAYTASEQTPEAALSSLVRVRKCGVERRPLPLYGFGSRCV